MSKRAKSITPTSGDVRPSHAIFVDTETYQQDCGGGDIRHTLRLGYAEYCRSRRGKRLVVQSHLFIRHPAEFWEWLDRLLQPKTRLYLIAHNLNFDLPVLDAFTILAERDFVLEQFYTKGMTGIFRWRADGRHLVGLDNGNFFAGKLDKWGTLLGYPKLPINFDTATDEQLIPYVKRDVEIMRRLWILWLSFLDDNDCGNFKYTAASTAFNTYRHAHMPEPIYLHNHKTVLNLERDAYKGGRTECFFKGTLDNDEFYYLDVNNMYGYVMAEHAYPSILWGHRGSATIEFLSHKLKTCCLIANVDLHTNDNPYPYVYKDHTCYPVGRYNTTLSTPELSYALQHGWIERINDIAWYRPQKLFKTYVEHFYALRKQYREDGNEPFATISKLLVNSLYGKFGQRGIEQRLLGSCHPKTVKRESIWYPDKQQWREAIYLGGSIIETWSEGESYHSFPAIAAHVTAYARMHLFKLMRSIPKQHVYYCDTDSLIVDSYGLTQMADLLDENRLGALKIERSSPWLTVNAPKDYQMENRDRAKGISDHAEQLDDNTYRQLQWRKLRGMIQLGDVSHYRAHMTVKHLSRQIYSGVVYPDGRVKPFELR